MKDLAYKVVFDKMMEYLNKGVAPWRQPWKEFAPINGKSKKAYRGVNIWLLAFAPYADPRWFTFKQVTAMGGSVKKGEKSTPVVFWKYLEVEDTATGKTKKFPMLRYYNVFNAEQTEGLNLPPYVAPKSKKNKKATDIVDGYKDCPEIEYGKRKAYYTPFSDKVGMPDQDTFESDDRFYATLFHELTHSTGHKDRLERKGVAELDRTDVSKYSEEELVAEMGSAFLCFQAGITNTLEASASYIDGWKKKLTDEPKMLVHAASQAQKAADYILGANYDDDEDEDTEAVVSNNPNVLVA